MSKNAYVDTPDFEKIRSMCKRHDNQFIARYMGLPVERIDPDAFYDSEIKARVILEDRDRAMLDELIDRYKEKPSWERCHHEHLIPKIPRRPRR